MKELYSVCLLLSKNKGDGTVHEMLKMEVFEANNINEAIGLAIHELWIDNYQIDMYQARRVEALNQEQ